MKISVIRKFVSPNTYLMAVVVVVVLVVVAAVVKMVGMVADRSKSWHREQASVNGRLDR